MSRAARARTQLLMMRAIERPFARAIITEKNRYIKAEAQSWYVRGDFSPALLQEHQSKMLAIYTQHGSKAVRQFGLFTAGGMKCGCEWCRETKAGVGIAAETFGRLARSWIGNHGAARVQQVAKTTREDLRRALLMAEDEQLDAVETEKALRAVAALSTWRSATIARTETHHAGMFASQGVADQIASDTGAVLMKEWITTEDERTRISHTQADGQKVDLRAGFIVDGEELEYPSDPSGSPENTINCRCVVGYDEA